MNGSSEFIANKVVPRFFVLVLQWISLFLLYKINEYTEESRNETMKQLSSSQVRQMYLDFLNQKGTL